MKLSKKKKKQISEKFSEAFSEAIKIYYKDYFDDAPETWSEHHTTVWDAMSEVVHKCEQKLLELFDDSDSL